MKLFAVSLYFETPWMIDVKTGSGIVPLPEHMTTNILADGNQFGALMKATMIHKDKGKHQWHSVVEIESVAHVQPSVVVSREDVVRWLRPTLYAISNPSNILKIHIDSVIEHLADALLNKPLQLPQPVAPVQGGGVDFMALPGIITAYYPFDAILRANGVTSNDEKKAIAQMAVHAMAKHLTTTQSAPVAQGEGDHHDD